MQPYTINSIADMRYLTIAKSTQSVDLHQVYLQNVTQANEHRYSSDWRLFRCKPLIGRRSLSCGNFYVLRRFQNVICNFGHLILNWDSRDFSDISATSLEGKLCWPKLFPPPLCTMALWNICSRQELWSQHRQLLPSNSFENKHVSMAKIGYNDGKQRFLCGPCRHYIQDS
jgi:hypothetical protein